MTWIPIGSKMFRVWFAVILAVGVAPFFGTSSPVWAEPLSPSAPSLLRSQMDVAKSMLEKFPPQNYDYVFVGRSGAIVHMALEELLKRENYPTSVTEFPLSGLRDGEFGDFGESYFKMQWYEGVLSQQIANYFPSDHSEKKIVVIDFVAHGGSTARFFELLNLAYNNHWIKREVHYLGLMGSQSQIAKVVSKINLYSDWSQSFNFESRLHEIRLPEELSVYFTHGHFKGFSQFKSWKFRDYDYEEDLKSYEILNRPPPTAPTYVRPRRNNTHFQHFKSRILGLDIHDRGEIQKYFSEVLLSSCEAFLKP